jgi:hypothetical protein
MDDATKARIVEAGARALFKAAHGRDGYHDAVPATQKNLRLKARACLTAALAAAEADGVVLVPTEASPVVYSAILSAQFSGATISEIYRAATLAGKVTL